MKKLIILLMVCTVVFLIGCQNLQGNGGDVDYDVQYIRTDGYLDGDNEPIVIVIKSVEELTQYYNENKDKYNLESREQVASDYTIGFLDATQKYDNEYFQKNALIMVLLEEGSGSNRHDVTALTLVDETIEINIKRIVPSVGTDDMAGWHVIIELNGENVNGKEIEVVFE